jgi:methyl-accepting chemotaxis protein
MESEDQRLINKHLALRHLLEAKSAHLKWRAYALGLVEGVGCSPDCAPLSSFECEFGLWYYGDGEKIMGDMIFFKSLEAPHEILHALYKKIYTLAQNGEIEEARKHIPSLHEMSAILLEALAYLEEEIRSLPPA